MKLKANCCEKFVRKTKACKRCPLVAILSARQRKCFLKEAKRRQVA